MERFSRWRAFRDLLSGIDKDAFYAVVSLLSFVCLFLGFHTLGLYVHNDVMQLALLPVFAEWLQLAHGSHLGTTLTAGDFLVHHAIALGLHTTTLVEASGIGVQQCWYVAGWISVSYGLAARLLVA